MDLLFNDAILGAVAVLLVVLLKRAGFEPTGTKALWTVFGVGAALGFADVALTQGLSVAFPPAPALSFSDPLAFFEGLAGYFGALIDWAKGYAAQAGVIFAFAKGYYIVLKDKVGLRL